MRPLPPTSAHADLPDRRHDGTLDGPQRPDTSLSVRRTLQVQQEVLPMTLPNAQRKSHTLPLPLRPRNFRLRLFAAHSQIHQSGGALVVSPCRAARAQLTQVGSGHVC